MVKRDLFGDEVDESFDGLLLDENHVRNLLETDDVASKGMGDILFKSIDERSKSDSCMDISESESDSTIWNDDIPQDPDILLELGLDRTRLYTIRKKIVPIVLNTIKNEIRRSNVNDRDSVLRRHHRLQEVLSAVSSDAMKQLVDEADGYTANIYQETKENVNQAAINIVQNIKNSTTISMLILIV